MPYFSIVQKHCVLIYFICVISLTHIASAKPVKSKQSRSISVETAMQRFINSVLKADSKTFLSFISRTRGWREVNTLDEHTKSQIMTISYSELSRDFQKRDGWYKYFFVGEMVADFADVMKSSKGSDKWQKVGLHKFIPAFQPLYCGRSQIYFRWMREKGKWVIAEVGFPTS